ncbi:MAG: SpoIIE family protein phosphatase [Nostocales cyanobacterium LacPavin_0920_SED1_MAG_38_18]|jgi:sigma-B regulation protein RsbU (phosphoserine phosphatase)|uniref:SpoIIE family protein phosphatase n=1 Tax=Aphanizomenon flos-aquae FACHB-1040 TaxID=2692887 RepID=A0ABR8BWD7_APHFL|nr:MULTISPECIES: SpoIIE family protein phosphatase [Aphanizomenon]MBO1070477.1 SpoIIE family protein phosphatase [Dolichospermum sp. DEX189]MCX5981072.1 SpoIIE family protein phosphatase [Nostocales cyanobacterium LacPavin_0920_SED1_MAG_38_18]QSV71456.1 MAG: SpoIIE family protein phosphatase [Aphanizomenon flos-aquae KM1D3_PB]KHG39208.1 regulator [Aphanizomenon flos-aquae 2012/KM1/D3]KHG40244.1 regulator [Aphanizomenon flos-aquae 2012/KM1/D3]
MFEILIIDDDRSIQIFLKRILEKQGYQVITASTGEEGILRTLDSPPALIICDWIMPGLTGIEVCNIIKKDPKLSTTFFILLTSLDSVADRVKGLDAGADDFISKPIEQNELQARVRAGLRLHQLSQDLQTQKLLLETELSEATEYVKSLLPLPINNPLSIQFKFLPSRQLGGDCLDYNWLDADSLAIYLLDVAGHGLKATLPSISVLNLLRSRALKDLNYYQPSEVLAALNNTFQINYQNDKYFTIWYGVYNRVSRQLTYSSAGHPPAIIISGNSPTNTEVKRLKTPGMPVGMFPEAKYVDAYCQIEKSSTLYIFSDGAYEITQSNGNLWSLEGFTQILISLQYSVDNQLDYILDYLINLNSKEIFEDDLSILQVKFD